MADVTHRRKDFTHALTDWQLVSDICSGERVVKAKKEAYLPKPNPNDTTDANARRYSQYIDRAVFYNATGRTLQGLVGAVFRKWPTLTVPAILNYAGDDIDGAGVSIYQQSQSTLANVLKKGRHALLADYPNVEAPASKAQQDAGLIRASIVGIDAEQVINWRTEKVGGVQRLSLVVICESAEQVTEDGFGSQSIPQYRVLKLVEGVYTVELWRHLAGNWQVVEVYQPRTGKGQYWNVIPLIFIGAQNNDTEIDESPLYDLARLNMAHYRNSADYEDSAFFVGQAQPWISGLTEEWRTHLEESGIYIGSRTPILLPEGGAFGFAQVNPNTLVKEAMDQKERQMVALGARLVERGQAVKTATEAQAENEAQHSALSLVANNVSEAYTTALGWMAQFMNASEKVEYTLNQDFIEQTLDAQMLTALITAWQSGRMPSSDLWMQFRKFGIIDPEKDDEGIKAELESEDAGLGLDDDGE